MTGEAVDKLITRRRAGQLCGMHPGSLYRLEKTGRFPPCVRLKENVVRYSLREVLLWIDERKREDRLHSWADAMKARELRDAEIEKLKAEAELAAETTKRLATAPRVKRVRVCGSCGATAPV